MEGGDYMASKKTQKTGNKTTNASSQNGKKGGLSTMTAGAAGAVVGAALGGAAGAALAQEKTRKMLGDVVENLGDYASDAAEVMRKRADTVEELGETVGE